MTPAGGRTRKTRRLIIIRPMGGFNAAQIEGEEQQQIDRMWAMQYYRYMYTVAVIGGAAAQHYILTELDRDPALFTGKLQDLCQ